MGLYVGGYHHFEVDRTMADQVAQLYPDLPLVARANRALLRRIVHFLSDQGIEQFIDVGSGMPTASNVHEIAQARNPNARVVYVENELKAQHIIRPHISRLRRKVEPDPDELRWICTRRKGGGYAFCVAAEPRKE